MITVGYRDEMPVTNEREKRIENKQNKNTDRKRKTGQRKGCAICISAV
jgi:hypothetical protein